MERAGPVGVPEGPDCTGSTVTACWRGLCRAAGFLEPAGRTRENRAKAGDRNPTHTPLVG